MDIYTRTDPMLVYEHKCMKMLVARDNQPRMCLQSFQHIQWVMAQSLRCTWERQ